MHFYNIRFRVFSDIIAFKFCNAATRSKRICRNCPTTPFINEFAYGVSIITSSMALNIGNSSESFSLL